jgi:hypothetical protein
MSIASKFVENYKNDPDAQQMAYEHVAAYCKKNNLDICAFVNDDKNIPVAAKEIRAGLPGMIRMVVSEDTIKMLVTENISLIRRIAAEKAGK